MIELNFGRNQRGNHSPNPDTEDVVDHIIRIPESDNLAVLIDPIISEKLNEKPSMATITGRPGIYIFLESGLDSSNYYLIWIEERKEWIVVKCSSVMEDVWGTIDSYSGPYAVETQIAELANAIMKG